jgi:hypothetical protein
MVILELEIAHCPNLSLKEIVCSVEYISQKNYVFEEFIPQKLNIYGSFV